MNLFFIVLAVYLNSVAGAYASAYGVKVENTPQGSLASTN